MQTACFVLHVCSTSMSLYNLPNVSELHGGNGEADGNFPQQRRRQTNDYIKSNYDKDTISFVFVTSMIQSH